mmetsp:Transcript_112332/g.350039  ORF Transcript_112332/g.350039 Transcript_112332/m.350039 type:complete len:111 (+) Transcript_112332:644-976(+)
MERPREEADHGSLVGLLRDHEGDLPVAVRQEDEPVHELVVVVACEDTGPCLGRFSKPTTSTARKKMVLKVQRKKSRRAEYSSRPRWWTAKAPSNRAAKQPTCHSLTMPAE